MSESSSKNTSYDADREHLGKIYAKGLIAAAEGQGVTEQVLAELDSVIDDVFDKLPDFEQLLSSPRIGLADKTRLLEQAFASQMSPLCLNFLKVTAGHGRLDCLRQIRTAAREQFNEMRGRVEVNVETAGELTPELVTRIRERLAATLGRQVELCCNTNPDLLGGLVIRVGDTVYDGSLSQQFEKMRRDTVSQTAKLIRDSLPRFVTSDE